MLQKLRKVADFCFLTRSSGWRWIFVLYYPEWRSCWIERFPSDAKDHIKLKRRIIRRQSESADTTWHGCALSLRNACDAYVMKKYIQPFSKWSRLWSWLNNIFWLRRWKSYAPIFDNKSGCDSKKKDSFLFKFNNWLYLRRMKQD